MLILQLYEIVISTAAVYEVVRKVCSHFEYLENRSRGLDVT